MASHLGNVYVQRSTREADGSGNKILHVGSENERTVSPPTPSTHNQLLSGTVRALRTSGSETDDNNRLHKTGEGGPHCEGTQTERIVSNGRLGSKNNRRMRHHLITARNQVPGLQLHA